MSLFAFPAFGFIVIFFAALLLFAEMLVKAKGSFAVLGSALFFLYFSYHLSEQGSTWIVFLLAGGLALIIIDGKIIANGSVALLGFVLMAAACALPAPSLLYGTLVVIAFVIGACGSCVFLKILPKRDYWAKLTLTDQLSGDRGYNSMNEDYKELVGKEGVTLTPCRPVGTVKIEGRNYSAQTDGIFLEHDTPVKVIEVDGTKITIEKKHNPEGG